MSVRPIIFSAPMVRALLDGRKSQTRRVMKPQPWPLEGRPGYWNASGVVGGRIVISDAELLRLHRRAVGDLLWVREAGNWRGPLRDNLGKGNFAFTFYAADSERGRSEFFDDKNRSPIHMPRWASRLTLLVTAVKVERLQDISEIDAIREGCTWEAFKSGAVPPASNPVGSYARIWESIHGPGSWEANPWIVAISFDVIKQNIDQIANPALAAIRGDGIAPPLPRLA